MVTLSLASLPLGLGDQRTPDEGLADATSGLAGVDVGDQMFGGRTSVEGFGKTRSSCAVLCAVCTCFFVKALMFGVSLGLTRGGDSSSFYVF